MPPLYFVRVVSDRWLGGESLIPVFLSSARCKNDVEVEDRSKLKGTKRRSEAIQETMDES